MKLLSLGQDLDLIAGQLNEQLDCQVKLDSAASHTFVPRQLVESLKSKGVLLQEQHLGINRTREKLLEQYLQVGIGSANEVLVYSLQERWS